MVGTSPQLAGKTGYLALTRAVTAPVSRKNRLSPLVTIALTLLAYSDVIPWGDSDRAVIMVWVITVFFGLNTLGNLASKSKREKAVMTPAAGLAFLCCLVVAVWGGS